jgi:osmoprotectant transport system permease protein
LVTGALANGSIAVKDAYSTDAKIEENDLVVLEDDLHFFPKYEAVFLFRPSTRADAIAALRHLEGTLDEKRMIRLNAEASGQRITLERQICISTVRTAQRGVPTKTLTIPFRAS